MLFLYITWTWFPLADSSLHRLRMEAFLALFYARLFNASCWMMKVGNNSRWRRVHGSSLSQQNVVFMFCFVFRVFVHLHCKKKKKKKLVVDFRRTHTQHAPLTISGASQVRGSSTKFLEVQKTEELSWTNYTALLAKKAQLYLFQKQRRAGAPAPIVCSFYRGAIDSIRFGVCSASYCKMLHHSEIREDHMYDSPLSSGNKQHQSVPKSSQHFEWPHPAVT